MVANHAQYNAMDVEEVMQQPVEMVKEYPGAAMMIVFGVGLGVGVLLSQAIPRIMHEPSVTEKLGRQIYDAVTSAIPEAFSQRFQS